MNNDFRNFHWKANLDSKQNQNLPKISHIPESLNSDHQSFKLRKKTARVKMLPWSGCVLLWLSHGDIFVQDWPKSTRRTVSVAGWLPEKVALSTRKLSYSSPMRRDEWPVSTQVSIAACRYFFTDASVRESSSSLDVWKYLLLSRVRKSMEDNRRVFLRDSLKCHAFCNTASNVFKLLCRCQLSSAIKFFGSYPLGSYFCQSLIGISHG